jgi:hypothetical protein
VTLAWFDRVHDGLPYRSRDFVGRARRSASRRQVC